MHRVLQLILNTAVEAGRIARNPASRSKLARDRERTKRFLTHEELAPLADAAGRDLLVVLVLGYCGRSSPSWRR
jgi:integrase